MATLTDNTKITRVEKAFATLASEYVVEGKNKDAVKVIEAIDMLSSLSKVRLFDILTKPY